MEPVLITITEAATALGIGRTTIYRLIGDGEIETVRIGSRQLVPVAAVRTYVERLAGATA